MTIKNSLSSKRSGFSLVEAAIVLGVVGLVIGGIWVAAAAVIENQKATRLFSAIVQVAQSTAILFPRSSYPTSSQLTVDSTLIAAGLIPQDLIYNGVARSPYGGTSGFTVNLRAPDVNYNKIQISVGASSIPRAACITLAQKLLGMRNRGLIGIYTSSAGFWITDSTLTWTKTLAQVQSEACTTASVSISGIFSGPQ